MATNEIEFRKWVKKNRPDIAPQLDALCGNQGAMTLIAMAFESGREYQRANPTAPEGPV